LEELRSNVRAWQTFLRHASGQPPPLPVLRFVRP